MRGEVLSARYYAKEKLDQLHVSTRGQGEVEMKYHSLKGV